MGHKMCVFVNVFAPLQNVVFVHFGHLLIRDLSLYRGEKNGGPRPPCRYSMISTVTRICLALDANSLNNVIWDRHGRLLGYSISRLSSTNNTSQFCRSGWSVIWFSTRTIFLVSVMPMVSGIFTPVIFL